MRITTALTVLQLGLMLVVSASVQGEQLPVNAHMDIYRAGGYDDGSDGVAPAVFAFAPRRGKVLVFAGVTGDWVCAYGETPYEADGTIVGGCYNPLGTIIGGPVGPFSGYRSSNFSGGLVGMFLEDTPPATPPAPLHFVSRESGSQGEITTDFTTLSPELGQVFFIGDGLTRRGFGQHQVFAVPPTATHLYLAYIDGCAPAGQSGPPGCYSDNAGTLMTFFEIQDILSNSESSK